MAGKSRNVSVEVSISGEQKYKQAISEINSANKTLGAEMKRLAEEYKGNEDSMSFLTQKGEALESMLVNQKQKIEQLREAVKISAQIHGEASAKTQQLAQQLSSAETSVIQLERAIADNNKAVKDLDYNTKEYDEEIRLLQSNLRVVDSQMAAGRDTVESLTQKDEILNQILEEQGKKLETLTRKLEEMAASGDATTEEINELALQVDEAAIAYNNTSAAIEKNKRALEENAEGIQEEEEELTGLGDTLGDIAQKFGITIPDSAKTALNGMESFSAGTVAKMAAVGAAIAAVIKVLKELNDLTLEEAAKVDEYITQSNIIDVPTQILEAWDYMAPLLDVDAETLKGAMTKITVALGDAADGNEAAIKKFEKLGIAIEDTDGNLRDSYDVFKEAIDALGKMENTTERDAAAMDLMGKSARDLNPLIIAGSKALDDYYKEAEALGYLLSEDQVKALGDVDDAHQRLQLTIEAGRKQLAAEFAPAAQAAMELFTDGVKTAGEWLKKSGLIENLASIITSLLDILRTCGELMAGIPGFDQQLGVLKITLGAIADFVAVIADGFSLVKSLVTLDFTGVKNSLGFGYGSGNANNLQRTIMMQNGDWQEYKDFYNSPYYSGYTGNASGNDNWRGGLTWVGENGPELVRLPAGSQIMNAQESRESGAVYIGSIVIDAKNVQEFNDVIDVALHAKERLRKR
jgi:predicted  nucleic acid-binding Zn-ribbon protein